MRKLFPFLFVISACAVVVHPTGGDKDETPPKALQIIPDSNTTHFSGDEIRIYFDEYFEIKDPNAILISPPPQKTPEIDVVKKHLRIQFKEKLRENSTYTIQLFDAIKDINEGNILPALQFSFSTGPTLDTLAFKGKVTDNMTGQGQKAFTVALFHSDIHNYPDSTRFPLYITKTLENGSFFLPAVKDGNYTVYAFNDINNNKLLDKGEDMGYLDDTQYPNDSIRIYTGKNNFEKPLVFSSPVPQSSNSFLLPIQVPEDYPFHIQSEKKSRDKTQILFTNFIHPDTLLVQDFIKSPYDSFSHYYLSKEDSITDTILVNFSNQVASTLLYPHPNNTLAPNDTFNLLSINALLSSRPGRHILLESDSILIQDYSMKHDPWKISFTGNLEHDKSYTLILKDSAFRFMDQQFSKADTFRFHTSGNNTYGDAAILFNNPKGLHYSIQLLSDIQKEVQYEQSSTGDSLYFSNLQPGEYFVRLILEDSMKKTNRLIPFEINLTKVYIHPTKLSIRGGWTIGDFLLNNEEE